MRYCPLCCAEYAGAGQHCSNCHAVLVDSLGQGPDSRKLLLAGRERSELASVAAALSDAEMPFYQQEDAAGGVGKVVGARVGIYVLPGDFDRALQITNSLVRNRRGTPAMKYCPLCDAGYSEAVERCTICGVDLVEERLRGQPLDERQRNERIEMVWRGGDPVAVSEVVNRLRDAGIRHYVQPTNDHLVFELGMPRPKYVVRAFASDVEKARELLKGIVETSPFSMEEGANMDDEPAPAPERREHAWNSKLATVVLWSGDDAALADLLEACLRENHIGAKREEGSAGSQRLLVMPEDEQVSREIIREVLEATPPA